MKKFIYILTFALFATSCTEATKEKVQQPEDTNKVEEEIALDEKPSGTPLDCTGEISVPSDAKFSVHSPFKGALTSINALEGEKVKKGQVLAILKHIEIIKIQEDYLKSRAQFRLSESDFERKKGLFDQKVIPLKDYQEAEAAYHSNKAIYESLVKQIRLLGLSTDLLNKGELTEQLAIRSPVNGYVTVVEGNNGMFVDQDTKIFELVDDSHKHLHLQVFASDISKVKIGQKITFSVAGSDVTHSAKVYLIGKSVESSSKAIDVHAHLENEASDLVIGSAVFAKIWRNE